MRPLRTLRASRTVATSIGGWGGSEVGAWDAPSLSFRAGPVRPRFTVRIKMGPALVDADPMRVRGCQRERAEEVSQA